MNGKIISTCVYDRHVCIHLHDDRIEHIRVISEADRYQIGTIAVGRVVKMIPSSNACFVDIGDETNYFVKIPHSIKSIHFTDGNKHTSLHCEDEIIVQISSESVKLKAPSATTELSLAGDYIVVEEGTGLSISKKINESARKSIVLPDNIDKYTSNHHIIVRTEAARLSDFGCISDEIINLVEQYDNIILKSRFVKGKTILFSPERPLISCVKEWLRFNPEEIITDNTDDLECLDSYFKAINKNITVRLYSDDNLPLYKLYKLESLLDELLAKKVYLKSGAFLVVEQGETLTAIDVNSGHAISGNKSEATNKINREAAVEIGHILRSRNISGMILIDFINNKDPKNERALIELVKEIVSEDYIRTAYVDMTGLGLVELTRQRKYSSLKEQWNR